MDHSCVYLVVMAGGSGTRFWPKSTSKRPKQLMAFGRTEPLLVQTLRRFSGLVPPDRQLVVTTELLKSEIERCVTDVRILAEPQGRNTAPCIYWAAKRIAELNPQAVMLVMPSDHYIADIQKFLASVEAATQWALENDDLVTLGVKPSRPETGYGYLKTGKRLGGSLGCRKVEVFVEKPGLERARQFLAAGDYLWNGGMFVWRVEVILRAFDQIMPEMGRAWKRAGGDVKVAYPKMTATSIDYGIMEKSGNVVTFPLDCGWDDLGSWTSLENLATQLNVRTQAGNVVLGGEVVEIESTANIVDASESLVALLGVKDLIVVEHRGAILVASKERAQDIRQVVDRVKGRRPDLT